MMLMAIYTLYESPAAILLLPATSWSGKLGNSGYSRKPAQEQADFPHAACFGLRLPEK
jgi:hypothetical protein